MFHFHCGFSHESSQRASEKLFSQQCFACYDICTYTCECQHGLGRVLSRTFQYGNHKYFKLNIVAYFNPSPLPPTDSGCQFSSTCECKFGPNGSLIVCKYGNHCFLWRVIWKEGGVLSIYTWPQAWHKIWWDIKHIMFTTIYLYASRSLS